MEEPHDRDLADTALRECEEEVGLALPRSAVLGSLSRLYVDVSRFSILPHVAVDDRPVDFVVDRTEVDEAFVVPLATLRKNIGSTIITRREDRFDVPCYQLPQGPLWGATAMITAELLTLLDSV